MNQVNQILSEAVEQVINGMADPLEVFAYLKEVEKHLAKCKEEIENDVFTEADRYGDKTFEHKGFKFTKTDGRATYDFKDIEQWNKQKEILKDIEEKSKAAAKNNKITMVTEDGEVIQPCLIKYSKPSISVSYVKH
jgi:beta-N-acetylglucosaminidase